MMPPMEALVDNFEMTEFFDDETRSINYALCKQFEENMAGYNEKGIIAFYYDGDYIFKDAVYCDYETIENRLKWDPYFQKAMELFFIF